MEEKKVWFFAQGDWVHHSMYGYSSAEAKHSQNGNSFLFRQHVNKELDDLRRTIFGDPDFFLRLITFLHKRRNGDRMKHDLRLSTFLIHAKRAFPTFNFHSNEGNVGVGVFFSSQLYHI
jgi:hypothetical protein